MCAVAPVLFLIQVLDWLLAAGLALAGGVVPRRLDGLDGVLLRAVPARGFAHLYANSIPLILLGTFVLSAGVRRFLWSTALIMLVSGVGVWLIGAPGTVARRAPAGSSSATSGCCSPAAWWSEAGGTAAVALLIGVLYGWQVQGVLPGQDGSISWEGHLFGFIGGVLAAILFRASPRHPPGDRGSDPSTAAARLHAAPLTAVLSGRRRPACREARYGRRYAGRGHGDHRRRTDRSVRRLLRGFPRPVHGVIDALPEPGGQVTAMYPEKMIYDVAGLSGDPWPRPDRQPGRPGRAVPADVPAGARGPRAHVRRRPAGARLRRRRADTLRRGGHHRRSGQLRPAAAAGRRRRSPATGWSTSCRAWTTSPASTW